MAILRPPRILAAPNAFKGSLTAVQAAEAISRGFSIGFPEAVVRLCPLADGGDGTLETLIAATGGEIREARVLDPLGREMRAKWGMLGGSRSGTAVIEMAEASGLRLLRSDERNPMRTSTFGFGQTDSRSNRGGSGTAAARHRRFGDQRRRRRNGAGFGRAVSR